MGILVRVFSIKVKSKEKKSGNMGIEDRVWRMFEACFVRGWRFRESFG